MMVFFQASEAHNSISFSHVRCLMHFVLGYTKGRFWFFKVTDWNLEDRSWQDILDQFMSSIANFLICSKLWYELVPRFPKTTPRTMKLVALHVCTLYIFWNQISPNRLKVFSYTLSNCCGDSENPPAICICIFMCAKIEKFASFFRILAFH